MAKDTPQVDENTAAPAEGDAPKAEPRKPSQFHIAVQLNGEPENQWKFLDATFEAVTQDDAKRDAARSLVDHPDYGPVIQGDGLKLAAVTARGFKPIVVKVEPQPAKLVLR
jgi:hypothetical protein